MRVCLSILIFFFFNDTATTEIYTLSLHDALPIWCRAASRCRGPRASPVAKGRSCRSWIWTRWETASHECRRRRPARGSDRKSTRLNSSHSQISYAVFCLKKKKKDKYEHDKCQYSL